MTQKFKKPADADIVDFCLAGFLGDDEKIIVLADRYGAVIVNAEDHARNRALNGAAMAGRGSTARLLLEKGADVNAATTDGATPLMMAAAFGQAAMARFLLESGADVDRAEKIARVAGQPSIADDILHWADAQKKRLAEERMEAECKDMRADILGGLKKEVPLLPTLKFRKPGAKR